MNNVNSISQMNSMVCEHSSLIGPDVKKGPIIGEQGPDGNEQQSQNKFLLRRLLTLLLILQVTAKNIPYFHPMTAVLPRRGHDLHRVFDQPRSCLSILMVGGLIILPTVLCLPRTTIVLMAPTDLKGQCRPHPDDYLILHPWNNRLMLYLCVHIRIATARVHLTSIICLLPERRGLIPQSCAKR